jgi:hypothetical protein
VTFAQRVWWILGIAWVAVILDVTLRSAPDQAGRVAELPWYCVLCGEGGIADVILNLLLFAPLGIAARALRLRWGAMAFAVALTVAIETTQARFLVGRDGSLGDVLANSGGAVLGWLAYPYLMQLARPSRTFARAGVVGVLALATVIWFATGIGLHPSLSPAGPWVGQLQHNWPGHDAFQGTIRTVGINGIPVPNDPLDPPATLRDSVELQVALTRTLPLPMRAASLVRIVDGRGHPQVSLTESGAELTAELQVRASRWGFHTPQWAFPGAMTMPPGEPWQVDVRWTPGRVSVTTADSSGARAVVRSQLQSIALGWVFIHPFVLVVSSDGTFWNCVWLGWWFGLIGWLGGALNWRTAGIAAVLQLATLVIAAEFTGATWQGNEVFVALAVSGLAAAAARFRAGVSPPPHGPISSE